LKQNRTIFVRKPNNHNYQSALEQARARFEEKLKQDKELNKKNLEDY